MKLLGSFLSSTLLKIVASAFGKQKKPQKQDRGFFLFSPFLFLFFFNVFLYSVRLIINSCKNDQCCFIFFLFLSLYISTGKSAERFTWRAANSVTITCGEPPCWEVALRKQTWYPWGQYAEHKPAERSSCSEGKWYPGLH